MCQSKSSSTVSYVDILDDNFPNKEQTDCKQGFFFLIGWKPSLLLN